MKRLILSGLRRCMRRRGVLVSGMASLIVAIVATGAYAYFSSSASGLGSAATGALKPLTVAALISGDSPSSALLPGGTADVILRVSNPNAVPVTLLRVASSGAISADGAHPGCTTTGVTFANVSGLSTPIAASGTTLVRLPGAALMSAASSAGCQGASFSIPVSISVRQG